GADLAAAFKDAGASDQRFEMRTFCSGICVLRMAADDGQAIERALADVAPGGIALGTGNIHFDAAASELGALSAPERANAISYRIREIVMRNFEFVRVPLLIVGFIAAFACLLWWRAALLNPAYVLGVAMWALAAS